MSPGAQDQPGQHRETPSLQGIQKLARHGGTHLASQLLGRLWQDNCLNPGGGGCSKLRSCHCTRAWITEQDSVSQQNKPNKKANPSLSSYITELQGLEDWPSASTRTSVGAAWPQPAEPNWDAPPTTPRVSVILSHRSKCQLL